jgi:hypothetical protein
VLEPRRIHTSRTVSVFGWQGHQFLTVHRSRKRWLNFFSALIYFFEDIDECAVGTSTSQNGLNGTTCPTARCINTPGDFFCCGSGYEAVSGVCRGNPSFPSPTAKSCDVCLLGSPRGVLA